MAVEIRLVIHTERLFAAELAKLLEDLNRSFKAFVKRREGSSSKAELAVSAVRHGSIEVVIGAIDALEKLAKAGQYLAPFATHLAQLVELAIGMQLHKVGSKISPADRSAISSLAGPVASGHANQINIVNNGNIILNIGNSKTAKAILDGLIDKTPQIDSIQTPAANSAGLTKQQISKLENGKLTGTAFLVNRTWYARLAGAQGVLVPIMESDKLVSRLHDGQLYAFSGRPLQGNRGETIGLAMEDAVPLGTKASD
jgi:hypothetical protein